MEKKTPHYPLARVKRLIRQGDFRVTRTALQCGVRDFGLMDPVQLASAVLEIRPEDFYKSMTTLHDSRLWQDVYHPLVGGTAAYAKVQIVDDETVVISFKALEDSHHA